uniref:Uncharacterized protein n=1 Tax=Knipowitschia caucasica TaxID=637954 RepID=A0AAV2MQ22_KNICA
MGAELNCALAAGWATLQHRGAPHPRPGERVPRRMIQAGADMRSAWPVSMGMWCSGARGRPTALGSRMRGFGLASGVFGAGGPGSSGSGGSGRSLRPRERRD